MSRGPGKIERAIRELFDRSPDRAFFAAEVVKHCFPQVRWIERKHEVSALRAARKIIAADPDWRISPVWPEGSIIYNHGNLQSYALYREIDRHDWDYAYFNERGTHKQTWARALAALADHQKEVTLPEGRWWLEHRLHCAERDGDTETAAALKTRFAAEEAALWAGLRAAMRPADPRVTLRARLAEVAGQLRELAAHNDPDVIRQGIAAIAEALENVAGPPPS